jgi:hypothetical protein
MADTQGVQPLAAGARAVATTFTAALYAKARAASTVALAWPGLTLDPTWRWLLLGLGLVLAGHLVGPRIADEPQNEKCSGNLTRTGPFDT